MLEHLPTTDSVIKLMHELTMRSGGSNTMSTMRLGRNSYSSTALAKENLKTIPFNLLLLNNFNYA
jgi:hypothetical protein